MANLNVDLRFISKFTNQNEIESLYPQFQNHNQSLHDGSGKGADFLGWLNLPSSTPKPLINSIIKLAESLSERADYIVVIGIGGSYLGSRAVIEALQSSFSVYKTNRNNPVILYAGNHLSGDDHSELLKFLKGKSFAVVVISKSGTTTEPALAFRMLLAMLQKRYDKKEVARRIVAITDPAHGALRELARKEGFRYFTIPENVGGRFSVLSPVGLLPIALAGYDIKKIMRGAAEMEALCSPETPLAENPAIQYAIARNILLSKGKNIEILANYQPKLSYFSEWWKQLYGESEGKEGKGIFPASVTFTADLHSMGQYIQEGPRNMFETVLMVQQSNNELIIPELEGNPDSMNFLAGKRLDEINRMAALGTMLAHTDGGVPVIQISIPENEERYLGQMIYFFEKACALSAYHLGVNPFDQPGVEMYKKNMYALLGKPGFEVQTAELRRKLEME